MDWEAASPDHVTAPWLINNTILLNEAYELVSSSENELKREIYNARFREDDCGFSAMNLPFRLSLPKLNWSLIHKSCTKV